MPTNKAGYLKNYYDTNKEKYHQQILCEYCNDYYTYTHKTRHCLSKKHIRNVNKQKPFEEKYKCMEFN